MAERARSAVTVLDPATVEPSPLRYDRGTVVRLVGPEIGAERVDLHVNTVRAGSAPGPYHLHTNAENVYYILRGTATVRSDGELHVVGPGKVVLIPPSVPHSLSNEGSDDLVVIEVYAPAGADFVELASADR